MRYKTNLFLDDPEDELEPDPDSPTYPVPCPDEPSRPELTTHELSLLLTCIQSHLAVLRSDLLRSFNYLPVDNEAISIEISEYRELYNKVFDMYDPNQTLIF